MTVTIEFARDVCRAMMRRFNVDLITPESPSVMRDAVTLAIAAASPLTVAEVRQRVSVYVPRLVDDVRDLLPAPMAEYLNGQSVMVSPVAWEDSMSLLCVTAHELGHHLRDKAARDRQGIVGSVLWASAYLIHPTVRTAEECQCFEHNLTMRTVVANEDPDFVMNRTIEGLVNYSASAQGMVYARAALGSARRSLGKGQLPGVDTPAHLTLREMMSRGWTPAERWLKVIERTVM